MVSISIGVRHNVSSVQAQLSPIPQRLIGAMRRGTTETTRAIERDAAKTMLERAGGVYWDIDSVVAPTPDGAKGIVRTPPSKPHPIEPTKEHGLLVFEINGRTIFVHGPVNHPGSNPLDWITPLETQTADYQHIYEDEVGEVFGMGSSLPTGI